MKHKSNYSFSGGRYLEENKDDKENKDQDDNFPMMHMMRMMPNFRKTFDGFVTEDMKEDYNKLKKNATRALYRTLAVLIIVPFGWIVFLTLHCFLWSANFTFYQNLVITFDSIIITVFIAVGLIYGVSGLRKVYKNARGLISKLTQKMKSHQTS